MLLPCSDSLAASAASAGEGNALHVAVRGPEAA